MSCKHGVETLCATCINDVMCDAIREEGRIAGIREAIAVARKIGNNAAAEDDHGMAACADSIVRKLRALLPPPSGENTVDTPRR